MIANDVLEAMRLVVNEDASLHEPNLIGNEWPVGLCMPVCLAEFILGQIEFLFRGAPVVPKI